VSRSRKKVPIAAITTSTSEKEEKRDANRKLRRMTREKVKKGEEELPGIREVSDVWDFSKDGKCRREDKKFLRK
jgi:hypothetical protein